ncbi:MAG TPA: ABC transporter permease [Solirubrobacteraceae bacterium]|nr:ABC transporter permease [Solirubrobacteraceae bacterium]
MTTLAASAPVIPDFGAGGTGHGETCEQANRLFCGHWFTENWDGVLWPALRQHVALTLIAVAIGFAISMTLALAAHRRPALEAPIGGVASVLYTIPSLALFELLVPIHGLGLSRTTAEVALVSYTLLILFRNILAGLRGVPEEVREAARGMGMSQREVLLRVELPLALPAIVAGLRIATVTVISLATVASFVDDEGLGTPIFQAIGNDVFKTELIAAGGLAVALAIAADALLVGAERLLSPWARVHARSR